MAEQKIEDVRNDLNVMMDFIHEIAVLSGETLPAIIDLMEAILESRPHLKEKFEAGDSGLKRMKRLWAYTRFACYMANGVQKHYDFQDTEESKKLSFPEPEIPDDVKDALIEARPPKEWGSEC